MYYGKRMVRRSIVYVKPDITITYFAQVAVKLLRWRAAQLKDGPTQLLKTMVLERSRM
jgi:hypothetical protein